MTVQRALSPARTSSPPPTSSPFAGVDVCAHADLALREGANGLVFDDDVWNFGLVAGIAVQLAKGSIRCDFTKIQNWGWRLVAKEYTFALLVPGHEAVAALPHAYRIPRSLKTCRARLDAMVRWLNWLTDRGVTELGQVEQHHCEEYLQYHSCRRDRHGQPIAPTQPGTRAQTVAPVVELALYGELLTADRYRRGFVPWAGRSAATVTGNRHTAENKTRPIPAEIFQPMLAAALYIVDTLGPHIVPLEHARQDAIGRERTLPTPLVIDDDMLLAVIRRHVEQGRPFDAASASHTSWRRSQGWHPKDPLVMVNLNRIAQAAGYRQFRPQWLSRVRPALTAAVAQVGVSNCSARDAALVTRADAAGEVPWTHPLHRRGIQTIANIARTACLLVTAALSGMRSGELMELRRGCHHRTAEVGGPVRYRLDSKLIKGQPLGGTSDQWVVTEEVFRAVDLAHLLCRNTDPDALLFGRFSLDVLYPELRRWVDGPHGQHLGLAPIPDGALTARMLRRTLAIELAYRPGGLLAAKIHLKHIAVAATEGYASRPGGAQARLLAEVAKEEEDRNLALLSQAYEDYKRGLHPAGPGARDLVEFFATIDTKAALSQADAPKIVSDPAIRNLLAKRAGALHPGSANYCWFVDPSRALCLKLAGTPTADKPLVGMCDSTRCPQATHHRSHRPVWAEQASTLKVFIGGISRRQKTERQRLDVELARVTKVIADIDAAAGGTPPEPGGTP